MVAETLGSTLEIQLTLVELSQFLPSSLAVLVMEPQVQ